MFVSLKFAKKMYPLYNTTLHTLHIMHQKVQFFIINEKIITSVIKYKTTVQKLITFETFERQRVFIFFLFRVV